MVKSCLSDEQQMFDMVPELYDQRDGPPFTRGAVKALAKRPDAHQHDQRVTIMQDFRSYQPGKPETEYATRFGPRPMQHPYLHCLGEMLSPVSKNNDHK